MAKKAAKKEAAAKPEFKYGIASVEEATGRDAASIRRSLRSADQFEKTGGVWGWNTKSDFEAVVKHIKPVLTRPLPRKRLPLRASRRSRRSRKTRASAHHTLKPRDLSLGTGAFLCVRLAWGLVAYPHNIQYDGRGGWYVVGWGPTGREGVQS